VTEALLAAGLACVIAAIVGGGLKAAGFDIPPLKSLTRQVLLGGLGVVLLIAAGVGRMPPPPPPPSPSPTASSSTSTPTGQPEITLSKNVGLPGTSLKLSAKGFAAGEPIAISFRTTELARPTADKLGAVPAQTIVIPQDWAFNGQFEVTAIGQQSIRRATAPFEILAPRIDVTPTRGPPGTTVTVSGTGFAVDERVEITLHLEPLGDVQTTSNGSFRKKVQIPSDWKFRNVSFSISATGETSHRTDSTSFRVT